VCIEYISGTVGQWYTSLTYIIKKNHKSFVAAVGDYHQWLSHSEVFKHQILVWPKIPLKRCLGACIPAYYFAYRLTSCIVEHLNIRLCCFLLSLRDVPMYMRIIQRHTTDRSPRPPGKKRSDTETEFTK
jgi:hypothetical protein